MGRQARLRRRSDDYRPDHRDGGDDVRLAAPAHGQAERGRQSPAADAPTDHAVDVRGLCDKRAACGCRLLGDHQHVEHGPAVGAPAQLSVSGRRHGERRSRLWRLLWNGRWSASEGYRRAGGLPQPDAVTDAVAGTAEAIEPAEAEAGQSAGQSEERQRERCEWQGQERIATRATSWRRDQRGGRGEIQTGWAAWHWGWAQARLRWPPDRKGQAGWPAAPKQALGPSRQPSRPRPRSWDCERIRSMSRSSSRRFPRPLARLWSRLSSG